MVLFLQQEELLNVLFRKIHDLRILIDAPGRNGLRYDCARGWSARARVY